MVFDGYFIERERLNQKYRRPQSASNSIEKYKHAMKTMFEYSIFEVASAIYPKYTHKNLVLKSMTAVQKILLTGDLSQMKKKCAKILFRALKHKRRCEQCAHIKPT